MSRDRLIQLFGYETDGGRSSLLWRQPMYFDRPGGQAGQHLDEAYEEWAKQKRDFPADGLLNGRWTKVGDNGRSFFVIFHPDGTLTECSQSDPETSWSGTWTKLGKAIRTHVGNYELDLIANREGNVHSAIEFEKGRSEPNAYFEFTHLPTEPRSWFRRIFGGS